MTVDVAARYHRRLRSAQAGSRPTLRYAPLTPRSLPNAQAAKLPASAGPFFVSEYRPGDYVQLARNPNYWKRDRPASNCLTSIPSASIFSRTMTLSCTRFLRGETHMIGKARAREFRPRREGKARPPRILGPSLDSEFLWFNQSPSGRLARLEKKMVYVGYLPARCQPRYQSRRHCAHRLQGHAHPAAGPVSPANRFWFNASLKPLPFDSEAALQIARFRRLHSARWRSARPRQAMPSNSL